MGIFVLPSLVALAVCIGAYVWGGFEALVLVMLLAILETTLSFDNAVVNAKILQRMEAKWQHRFLTWGIPVAVFGTRFLLPLLIVSAAAFLSPLEVARLAFFEPSAYFQYLSHAHTGIASFGGAFLLMVALKYFFNEEKRIHWIGGIERHLSRWGGVAAIEFTITLATMLACAALFPHEAFTILFSGAIGILLFVGIEAIAETFEVEAGHAGALAGMALFFYLNTLDAAFSLDGVVAAFAITDNLPVIIGGLGIGALFVRAFTVRLVREKTLDTLIYLEHGAHWAIFGLALSMLASIFVSVPEVLPGLVGLFFIVLAYLSSRRALPKL
jgi:hypothetical protein